LKEDWGCSLTHLNENQIESYSKEAYTKATKWMYKQE